MDLEVDTQIKIQCMQASCRPIKAIYRISYLWQTGQFLVSSSEQSPSRYPILLNLLSDAEASNVIWDEDGSVVRCVSITAKSENTKVLDESSNGSSELSICINFQQDTYQISSNTYEHIISNNSMLSVARTSPKIPYEVGRWMACVPCSIKLNGWMQTHEATKKTRANGSDCEESQLSANERCMANKMCLTDIMRNVRNFHPVFMKSFSRQQTDEWNCTSYLQHISIWKYLIEEQYRNALGLTAEKQRKTLTRYSRYLVNMRCFVIVMFIRNISYRPRYIQFICYPRVIFLRLSRRPPSFIISFR